MLQEQNLLMVKAFPDLFITAMFDPTIDNEGGGSLEKEDGIVEILEAYNKHFNQKYTIPTYDKFRKEVSLRLLSQYGLVNEMSKEMLNAIDGEEFGPALDILMDKHICNYTARLLRSITGLDNRTISNMKKGENLTKSNVISACLGIHIPFRVSNHMLSLADLTLNMTSKGQVGDDNETYDMLLHLKWTTDYDDIYEELKVQSKDYLIHQPPVKK